MGNWKPSILPQHNRLSARDVSENTGHELRRRGDLQLTDLPKRLVEFVARQERESHDRAQLRLV